MSEHLPAAVEYCMLGKIASDSVEQRVMLHASALIDRFRYYLGETWTPMLPLHFCAA